MHFLKSLLRGFNSLVFKLSLLLLVVIAPLVMVFGTAGPLKQSLRTSKIYNNSIDKLLESPSKKDTGSTGNSTGFDQPGIQQAARLAITPAFIQGVSEQVIDSLYNWLSGKTPSPEFKIDVSAAREKFIQSVSDYAVNRAKELPACTLLQARQLANESIDPLTVPCVPAGFDIDSLRAQVTAQLNKPDGDNTLLQQPIITPDSLPKDDSGKTPVQNLTAKASNAPEAFHWFTLTPWVVGGFALASGGLVVLLYDEKRRGVRNLAIALMGVGVTTLLSTSITSLLFAKLDSPTGPLAKKTEGALQQPTLNLIHSLTSTINHKILLFGIIYTVVGAITLMVLHFTKTKRTVLLQGRIM